MNVEKILRTRTMGLFSDDWYFKTSEEILKTKETDKGYVYFVKNGDSGLVKIGKAYDMSKRIKGLMTSFGKSAFVCGFIYSDNYSEIEISIHKFFAEKRQSGEWFDLSTDEINEIILQNSGTLVNSYFNKKSVIVDGICFGFKDVSENNYYTDFFDYVSKIPKGKKVSKTEFYNNIINLSPEYAYLSPKRVNLVLKDWAKSNNVKYFEYNTNGVRGFILG